LQAVNRILVIIIEIKVRKITLMHKLSQHTLHWIFLIILLIAILLFFVSGPDYYSSRSYKSLWDQGHIIFYTMFTFYLLRFFPWFGNLNFPKQLGWGLLITLSSGIIIELVQINFSRFPEISDIWRDGLGCAFALICFSRSAMKISERKRYVLKILIIIFILFEFSYPVKAIIDENIARRQFPILSGFETPFETDRWEPSERIKRANAFASEGKYSAEIYLTTEKYSGISLKYFPRNWQNYNYLHFSVYNSSNQSLMITCLIHDWEYIERDRQVGDRFNKKLILQPGWNSVRIPLLEIQQGQTDRFLNLQKIYSFGFFVSNLQEPLNIYIDEIKLKQ